jgi:hypothetical protein
MSDRRLQFAVLRANVGQYNTNEILLDLIDILESMDKEYTEDIDELMRQIKSLKLR